MDIGEFIREHLRKNKIVYDPMELHELCKMSVEAFKQQPMLVKMNPPCVVVGDLQGQYCDLLSVFGLYSEGQISGAIAQKYVFLGNYIGPGGQSVETLCIILALMLRFPSKYLVLRGNQEISSVSRICGFHEELVKRFGASEGEKIWDSFNRVFQWMPIAALIGEKVICVHAGISPHLKNLGDITKISRPLANPASIPLAHDLLWGETMMNIVGFTPNAVKDNSPSVFFGEDVVHKICKEFGLALIIRSHQPKKTGVEMFADSKVCSIFTAPRFKNSSNSGAALRINVHGRVGIDVLRPVETIQDREMTEETTEESAKTVDTFDTESEMK